MSQIPDSYINNMPLYWRNEASGTLSIAVHRFFKKLPLHPDLIILLKDYIRHWINCPGFDLPQSKRSELNDEAIRATSEADIVHLLESCLSVGLDPF